MTDPIIPAKASKTGRPKAATVKDHWISFRVTAEEHFQLLNKAERSGMSAGEYARLLEPLAELAAAAGHRASPSTSGRSSAL